MTVRRSKKPPKPHNRGFSGKTTKLSFTKFIHYLLELNEDNPPEGKRLTDEDIIESATAEFGKNPVSVRHLANPYSSASLSTMRAKYNGEQPPLLSVRYNDDEEPCRNYRHPLDIDILRLKAFKYKIIDPRLFTLDEIKKMLMYVEEHPEDYQGFSFPSKELLKAHPFGSLKFNPKSNSKPTLSLSEIEIRVQR